MKVALVVIVKDEVNLQEWVDYHYSLGFNNIFLITNDWPRAVLPDNVTTYQYNGTCQQVNAYNDWITKFGENYTHVAFFDADEYLYLNDCKLIDILYVKHNTAVNWVFFGSTDSEGKGVIGRFMYRDDKPDKHIKSILSLNKPVKMINPHFSDTVTVSTNGEQVIGPFSKNPTMDKCFLAHYYYQNYEYWKRKVRRGRSDIGMKHNRLLTEWGSMPEYNKVFDDSLKLSYEHIKTVTETGSKE